MTLTRRAALGACLSSPLLATGVVWADDRREETRIVPSTGARIPVVGLGTWITFNVGSDPALLARSARVMEAFFAEGGGVIDSSPMYGSSQQTVGRGLSKLGHPETLFAADKVWTSSVDEGPDQIARTRSHWGVPRFDLLQVHNLRAAEGHLETLFAMKERGEAAHVGVTTSHGRRHDDLEAAMRRHPLDFVQLTYNILDREAESRLLPLARERGIGVIVNRPFRRGDLIERFRGAPLPSWAGEIEAASWAQILLKFVISHPDVTAAIPATTRPEHLRENKRAARGALPDADLRRRMAEDLQAL
ncbi:MAG: aldo/keto reductase [Pseudomonadota bacterium]